MSTATIAPAALAGSFRLKPRILLREAGFEFLRLSRTRSFSLSIMGFPIVFYLFFGLLMNRGENIGSVSVAKYMLASYGVFGMVGAALFGVGVGLASELAAGWLDLRRASPMPASAYIFAKCVSAMAFGCIIFTVLTVMGIFIGHVSVTPLEYVRLIGLTCVGVLPFALLGMTIALLVPPSSAPGITNIIYLPMSFCGGLWVPIKFLPKFLQSFATLLPTYHLSQLALGVFGYATPGTTFGHWLGILVFTLIMLGTALIAFRRYERNS